MPETFWMNVLSLVTSADTNSKILWHGEDIDICLRSLANSMPLFNLLTFLKTSKSKASLRVTGDQNYVTSLIIRILKL